MTHQYIPSEITYKGIEANVPRYRFTKMPLNNITGNSVTITPNGTQLLEWKIGGSTVFNLGKSFVQYQLQLPANGASTNSNNATWAWADAFTLGQSIQFGTAGGLYLTDLQYANNYSRVARRLNTKLQDFMQQDPLIDGFGPAQCGGTGNQQACPTLYPANNMNVSVYSYGLPSGVASSVVPVNNLEPLNTVQQVSGKTTYLSSLYPLSAFKDTCVGMDKDQYYGVDMYLRITAGPGNKQAFGSTGAAAVNDPYTGAAAQSSNITAANLYLFLAVEQNAQIVESIIAAWRSGTLKYQIPYTTVFRNTMASNGSSLNFTIQLSRQYGKKLKKILNIPMNGNEASGSYQGYDCCNYNGTKLVSYQTFLDSRPLQDNIITCTQVGLTGTAALNDDWRENRRWMKGTVYQNMPQYQNVWFHMDSFEEKDQYNSTIPEENLDVGLPMDSVKLYTFQSTSIGNITGSTGTSGYMNGINMYTYATFVKDVTASPAGPLLD